MFFLKRAFKSFYIHFSVDFCNRALSLMERAYLGVEQRAPVFFLGSGPGSSVCLVIGASSVSLLIGRSSVCLLHPNFVFLF